MKLDWEHRPRKGQYEAKVKLGAWITTIARAYQDDPVCRPDDWSATINGIVVINPKRQEGSGDYGFLELYKFSSAKEAMTQVEKSLRSAALALAESLTATFPLPLMVGDEVVVACHNLAFRSDADVTGTIVQSTIDCVTVRQEDGTLRYFGSYDFDKISIVNRNTAENET